MAVWLSHDSYDHDDRTNHISATSLLKPLKQLILSARVDKATNPPDIMSLIPSRIGTAIHDSLESTWLNNYKESLKRLNVPKKVIERVVVNPKTLNPNDIPVYLEQRSEKQIEGFIVSGKFDFVGDGRVEDLKTTSVYTYINNTNDEKYILQGSIYRWLNPEIITRDEMAIQYVFTDWSAARTREPKYPNARTLEKKFTLLSYAQTELFIRKKLKLVKQYWDAKEADIPECSDEELWRKADVWKYYKNPEKTSRSTKNYDTQIEADMRVSKDGGIVIKKPGEIVACRYCEAFPECKQKDRYLASGELVLGG